MSKEANGTKIVRLVNPGKWEWVGKLKDIVDTPSGYKLPRPWIRIIQECARPFLELYGDEMGFNIWVKLTWRTKNKQALPIKLGMDICFDILFYNPWRKKLTYKPTYHTTREITAEQRRNIESYRISHTKVIAKGDKCKVTG